uniref:SET domain-containing protein n=1 Tax=Eutreptiella gymnastica TaxID=73025 RepID=A0A7S4CB43_9EUGL
MASAALAEEDPKKAIEYLTKCIEQDPEDATLLSNRSAAYGKAQDYHKGLEDAIICTQLAPKWPKAYFRAAVHCRSLRDYDAAMQYLKSANKLQPENQEIVDLIEQTKLDLFFAPKVADKPIQVKYTGGPPHGLAPNKCVRVQKRVKKGTTIFKEAPVVSVQSVLNEESVPACHHCMKSLVMFEDLRLPTAMQGLIKDWPGLAASRKPVRCKGCSARFCSTKCLEQAKKEYHAVQCNLNAPAFRKFDDWCRNAVLAHKTDAGLLQLMDVIISAVRLAAKMFCVVVQSHVDNNISIEQSIQPFAPFVHGHAGINQDHLAFDYRPAFVLLRSALLSNGREGLPALSEFLNLEQFLKMVRRVALSCAKVTSNPFLMFCERVANRGSPQLLLALDSVAASKMDETEACGVGLFHLHASINHSCSPNVHLVSEEFLDHSMAIVAIADLRSGDEVLSNYLPSADLPLKERQQRLKECYEFQCHCTLCSTQSAKR